MSSHDLCILGLSLTAASDSAALAASSEKSLSERRAISQGIMDTPEDSCDSDYFPDHPFPLQKQPSPTSYDGVPLRQTLDDSFLHDATQQSTPQKSTARKSAAVGSPKSSPPSVPRLSAPSSCAIDLTTDSPVAVSNCHPPPL